jgi:hypothetical protein
VDEYVEAWCCWNLNLCSASMGDINVCKRAFCHRDLKKRKPRMAGRPSQVLHEWFSLSVGNSDRAG